MLQQQARQEGKKNQNCEDAGAQKADEDADAQKASDEEPEQPLMSQKSPEKSQKSPQKSREGDADESESEHGAVSVEERPTRSSCAGRRCARTLL